MVSHITPNILVCGKTGVGKTSLIQAVTHVGTVPEDAIGHAEPTTKGFDVYPTEVANFIDCEGMEPGRTVEEYSSFIMDEVNKRLETGSAGKIVHNIWYCIDGSGGRVLSADANLIRTFSDKALLVVTKAEIMRSREQKEMLSELLDLLPKERIVMVSSLKATGLEQLMKRALEMTSKAIDGADAEIAEYRARWKKYYRNMVSRWKDEAGTEADEFIYWGTGRAAAIAAVPLPLADIGPLMLNEAYMIYRIGAAYGYAVDKNILTMLVGVAGASLTGKLAATWLPFLKIPIAAGITFGVGKAARAYFESGMELSPEELKKKFAEGRSEAKKTNWEDRKIDSD